MNILRSRYKMAFVVRTDLSMQKGKIASQVAHAAVQLCLLGRSTEEEQSMQSWLQQGQPKIVLKVKSLSEVEAIIEAANYLGLRNAPVLDAGHTQVLSGSLTVLGLGPAPTDILEKVVGHLKLL